MWNGKIVSVIVPAYNEEDTVREIVEELFRVGPVDEVIVVDNNSTDRTREIVEKFAREADFPVIYVVEEIRGSSEARNAGIRRAQGEIISFLDDDILVFPDWLVETWKGFANLNVACIGGKALLPPELHFPGWWDHSYDGPIGNCDLGEEVIFNQDSNLNIIGANVSFRRSVFEVYGLLSAKLSRRGNNLVMGEDSDFIRRLRANGDLAAYYPKSAVYHVPSPSRLTLAYLSRWYYRRGEWERYAGKDETKKPEMVFWFGAPRWLYGALSRMALRTAGHAVRLQKRKAVYCFFQICFFWGYLVAFWKTNKVRPAERPANGTILKKESA